VTRASKDLSRGLDAMWFGRLGALRGVMGAHKITKFTVKIAASRPLPFTLILVAVNCL